MAASRKRSKGGGRGRSVPRTRRPGVLRRLAAGLARWALRALAAMAVLAVLAVLVFSRVDPPRGIHMRAEAARLGEIDQVPVRLEEVSPHMRRAVIAAEDANFCRHWGFDMGAIRSALAEGAQRGASTITQQVVKNVFLWPGRSWPRKALEALLTPLVELVWSKRRILEVYLNVAEFGEGIFGVEAASRRFFGIGPEALGLRQAALLAAVLPDPKRRSPVRPSPLVLRRAAAIMDGAETLRRSGRAACVED